jgi:hypothetical protein
MGQVLLETLEDFDVEPAIISRIVAQVMAVRDRIVGAARAEARSA